MKVGNSGLQPVCSTSPFRIYDVPLEIRLQILEFYVSTLYPRVVYRCFCHLCDPTSSTSLSSIPNLDYQRELHRHKYQGPSTDKDAKFRRRFSYCEDLPLDPNIRRSNCGSGQDFDFPYRTGTKSNEPGVFLASKELRQDVVDAMVRTRPLFVFSQDTVYWGSGDRYRKIRNLPAWYREVLRFAEELRPHSVTIFTLIAGWPQDLPKLREVRLNQGRIKMNTRMWSCEEILHWAKGVPRDLLIAMVGRRVHQLMLKICIGHVQNCKQEQQALQQANDQHWLHRDHSNKNYWDMATLKRSTLERDWKIVVLAEFRIKVRENNCSKRKWASIHAIAKEIENCRTYSLDVTLNDRLLSLEQNVEGCLCLVARSSSSK